ncbi:hypothetical protein [Crocosphaera sp. Alani8]|uniref:hypothetical protein n=1 Tax=Crocosphaera sp. Alani8 TaxID=3038952 RepID=UPI00313F2A74
MNVGHGDCTIIEHSNGNLTVIDINNAKDLDITTQQELSLFSQFSFPTNQNQYETTRQRYTYFDSVTAVRGYDIQLTNPIEFLQNNYSNANIFRFDIFNGNYGLFRGIASAFIVSFILFLIENGFNNWKILLLLLLGILMSLLRMYRFGQLYAKELFFQFIQLPKPTKTTNDSPKIIHKS